VGFVVDKVALGQVFCDYFGFPCQFSFHGIAPQSPSSIIWDWYNRPVVAAVPSGLSLTPLRIINKKITPIVTHQNPLESPWRHGDSGKLIVF
jgi:hypothetical protein